MIKILVVFAIVFLSGCAASGPAFSKVESIPENSGVVYIFREKAFVASIVEIVNYIDGSEVSRLKSNGYSSHIVTSGEHEIVMQWDCAVSGGCTDDAFEHKVSIPINIEEKQSMYFQLSFIHSIGSDQGASGQYRLNDTIIWSFKEVAESEISDKIKRARQKL